MILYVRFRLEPMYEALLPQLVGMLGQFTPVVEAAPPDAALADVRGAVRYFGRGPAGLAAVIRVRALALYGVECAIGAGPNPMLARATPRSARPTRCSTPTGGGTRST
ncbi:hypothetical protein ABZ129_22800, partial [Streptomyces sp. NPDC006307]